MVFVERSKHMFKWWTSIKPWETHVSSPHIPHAQVWRACVNTSSTCTSKRGPSKGQSEDREGRSATFDAVLTRSNQAMIECSSRIASIRSTRDWATLLTVLPEIMAPKDPLLSVKIMTCFREKKLIQVCTPRRIARHSSSYIGCLLCILFNISNCPVVKKQEKCPNTLLKGSTNTPPTPAKFKVPGSKEASTYKCMVLHSVMPTDLGGPCTTCSFKCLRAPRTSASRSTFPERMCRDKVLILLAARLPKIWFSAKINRPLTVAPSLGWSFPDSIMAISFSASSDLRFLVFCK